MAKETKKSKKEKTRKEGKGFFKEFRAELKKVVWPTPKQLVKNTGIVIGMILITAAIVFCLDVLFDNGYQFAIGTAESVIKKIDGSDTTNTTENTVENVTGDTTENEVAEETTENVVDSENTVTSENVVAEETDE